MSLKVLQMGASALRSLVSNPIAKTVGIGMVFGAGVYTGMGLKNVDSFERTGSTENTIQTEVDEETKASTNLNEAKKIVDNKAKEFQSIEVPKVPKISAEKLAWLKEQTKPVDINTEVHTVKNAVNMSIYGDQPYLEPDDIIITQQVFDKNGNLIQDGTKRNYYDENGNLIVESDLDSAFCNLYEYDDSGKKIKEFIVNKETGDIKLSKLFKYPSPDTELVYNSEGQIQRERRYDSNNSIVEESCFERFNRSYTKYTYYSNGSVKRDFFNLDAMLEFTEIEDKFGNRLGDNNKAIYDKNGHTLMYTCSSSNDKDIKYDDNGRIIYDGAFEYEYNNEGLLEKLSNKFYGTDWSIEYKYDKNGNVNEIVEKEDSQTRIAKLKYNNKNECIDLQKEEIKSK